MLDIHSHILYGIDDGSKSKEESIELLKQLEKDNITEIILTPHYIENTKFNATVMKKKKLIKELEGCTKIKLYIGNEVYFSDNTLKLLKSKKISTLNNSRYLLIELPMFNKLKDIEEMVFDLMINNIVPIIAHPERYSYVQSNIKYLESLKKMGVLFQANYGSLIGQYGRKCQSTVKKLLKNNYITFMGTDIHHLNYSVNLEKSIKKLKKIVKNDQIVENITKNNIKKVIANKEL